MSSTDGPHHSNSTGSSGSMRSEVETNDFDNKSEKWEIPMSQRSVGSGASVGRTPSELESVAARPSGQPENAYFELLDPAADQYSVVLSSGKKSVASKGSPKDKNWPGCKESKGSKPGKMRQSTVSDRVVQVELGSGGTHDSMPPVACWFQAPDGKTYLTPTSSYPHELLEALYKKNVEMPQRGPALYDTTGSNSSPIITTPQLFNYAILPFIPQGHPGQPIPLNQHLPSFGPHHGQQFQQQRGSPLQPSAPQQTAYPHPFQFYPGGIPPTPVFPSSQYCSTNPMIQSVGLTKVSNSKSGQQSHRKRKVSSNMGVKASARHATQHTDTNYVYDIYDRIPANLRQPMAMAEQPQDWYPLAMFYTSGE